MSSEGWSPRLRLMRSLAACLGVILLLSSLGCGASRMSLKQSVDRCLIKSGNLIVSIKGSSFRALKRPRAVRSWEVVQRPTPPFEIDSESKLQPTPHEVELVAFQKVGGLARQYVTAWRVSLQRRLKGMPQMF